MNVNLPHPSIGTIAANELGSPEAALPHFVSVGGRSPGAGFLGSRFEPLVVVNPARGVENLRPSVDNDRFATASACWKRWNWVSVASGQLTFMGGGIPGGQVIDRTDAEAANVKDRPVGTLDFMATVCLILGIDHDRENIANGRPIRIVDSVAIPIKELIPSA